MDATQGGFLGTVLDIIPTAVLLIGALYAGWQVDLFRRSRDDENRARRVAQLVQHNAIVLENENARSVIARLEDLRVPAPEEDAKMYWTFRGVHVSHINMIWPIWELVGRRADADLEPGYDGWQRFAQIVIAAQLKAAASAVENSSQEPRDLAGADLWKGMEDYELVPLKFFRWLQWLADKDVTSKRTSR